MTPSSLQRAALLVWLVPCLALAASKASFVHAAVTEGRMGEPLVIEGSLTGSANFERLVVKVRGPGEDFEEVTLELQYGDLYRVKLPASRMVPPGIEYCIEGVPESGERVALFASAAKPQRVAVAGDKTWAAEDKDGGKDKDAAKEEARLRELAKRCKKNKKLKECRELDKPKDGGEAPKEQVTADKGGTEVATADPKAPKTDPKKNGKKGTEEASGGQETSGQYETSPGGDGPARDHSRETGARDSSPRGSDRGSRDGAPKETGREQAPRDVAARGKGEPAKPRTELEEELAVYGAEDSGGQVQHLESRSLTSTLAPTVLTAADLRKLGVRIVAEALDSVQGLSVSRDVQGNYRVAVRGIRSDPELLVLLDGQRLNNFYDGKALLTLPVETLARIEIFRGPAAADVGLGDVLGVVNLVTDRDEGLRVTALGGIYDAFEGHLSAGKHVGSLELFASGDVTSQYGYRKPVLKDGLDLSGLKSKSTSDKRFFVNAGGGLSYRSDDLGTIEASGRFLLEDRSALIGNFDVVGNDSRLQWMVIHAQAGWKRPVSESATVSVRAWFDQQNTNRLWQMTPDGYQVRASDPTTLYPDGMLEDVVVGSRGLGLDARVDATLPAQNRLSAGLSGSLQSLSDYAWLVNYTVGTNVATPSLGPAAGVRYPTVDATGARGKAADRLGIGLFVLDSWTPNAVVAVQAGVRLDLVQLPTAVNGAFTGTGLTPGIGPRIGVVLAPIDALALRLHYGRSFRAPTVQELAEQSPNSDIDQGHYIGNPSLQPAVVDAVDASFEYLQGIGDARLRLRASTFLERFSNAIVALDSTGNLMPYGNRPLGVQALGLDGEARLELSRRAQAWVNSSWVRAEDLGTPATGKLLTDVPQARLNAGFSLPVGPWLNLDVTTRYASERRSLSRSVLEQIRKYTLPGYTLVGAGLRTEPLFDVVEIGVMGQNVFNFEYADDAVRPDRVNGVPRESVLVFGTLRVKL